jgi:uncharacterized membrane protein YbhN (UPF0104 family)
VAPSLWLDIICFLGFGVIASMIIVVGGGGVVLEHGGIGKCTFTNSNVGSTDKELTLKSGIGRSF